MADPVQSQGVGGGEGVPAAVADTPSVGALPETAVPEAQAADSSKEVSVPQHEEQNNQEAKVETQQAGLEAISDTLNGANVNVVTEGPDEVKVGPPVNATTQAEQSTVLEPSNNGEIMGVETVAIPEVSSNVQNGGEGGWQKRESELLKKIEELEKVKNARSEDGLRLELKVREEEIDLLKARVKNLEMELQVALSKPGGGKNHEMIESIKQQHEELLSKARGMIFDKTKMVKNQELQIEALTTQVSSLKDINQITKDLLEIRNSEVKAMEERFQAMEARYKAEKERYDLVLKRAQTSTNINDDLRKEYETQLAIFKELREKYELRVQALVAENNRLKESVKGPGTSQ